jgi:hypothetical protein
MLHVRHLHTSRQVAWLSERGASPGEEVLGSLPEPRRPEPPPPAELALAPGDASRPSLGCPASPHSAGASPHPTHPIPASAATPRPRAAATPPRAAHADAADAAQRDEALAARLSQLHLRGFSLGPETADWLLSCESDAPLALAALMDLVRLAGGWGRARAAVGSVGFSLATLRTKCDRRVQDGMLAAHGRRSRPPASQLPCKVGRRLSASAGSAGRRRAAAHGADRVRVRQVRLRGADVAQWPARARLVDGWV